MLKEASDLIEYITLKSNWDNPKAKENIQHLALKLKDAIELLQNTSSKSDYAKCLECDRFGYCKNKRRIDCSDFIKTRI